MIPTVTARWAEPGDSEEIYKIYRQSHYDLIEDRSAGFIRTFYEEQDFSTATAESELIVGLADAKVAGYLVFRSNPQTESLLRLKVLTESYFQDRDVTPSEIAYGLQWAVSTEWRRCGILSAMTRFLAVSASPKHFVSSITKGNDFSKSVFDRMGGTTLFEDSDRLIVCYSTEGA
jgi:hypothetical protein